MIPGPSSLRPRGDHATQERGSHLTQRSQTTHSGSQTTYSEHRVAKLSDHICHVLAFLWGQVENSSSRLGWAETLVFLAGLRKYPQKTPQFIHSVSTRCSG